MLVRLRSTNGPVTINPDYVTHIMPAEMADDNRPGTTPNCLVHVKGGGVAGVVFTIIGSLADLTETFNTRSAE